MQTRGKLFDDLSQLMTNAAGIAQGAREEAEQAMRTALEKFLRDSNLVTAEEFEVVRGMAERAREENEALKSRIEALEAQLAQSGKAEG
ncbi:MAG: accessory factor UbiK family protein [Pseudomonadota bacterium]